MLIFIGWTLVALGLLVIGSGFWAAICARPDLQSWGDIGLHVVGTLTGSTLIGAPLFGAGVACLLV